MIKYAYLNHSLENDDNNNGHKTHVTNTTHVIHSTKYKKCSSTKFSMTSDIHSLGPYFFVPNLYAYSKRAIIT